jgi:hypothetical protein
MPITIYDYTLEDLYVPLFYKKIKDMGFLVDLGDQFRFQLPDTHYYIFLTLTSFAWVYYPPDGEPELVGLEDLLDNLPEGKKEPLLYHLDILKNEKKK